MHTHLIGCGGLAGIAMRAMGFDVFAELVQLVAGDSDNLIGQFPGARLLAVAVRSATHGPLRAVSTVALPLIKSFTTRAELANDSGKTSD